MPRSLTGLLVLGLAVVFARSDDKPTKASPSFESLRQEFEEAQAKFRKAQEENIKALQNAKTEEEKKELQKKLMHPLDSAPFAKFAPRFLALAEQNPADPEAMDAIVFALRIAGGPRTEHGTWPKIVAHLQAKWVSRPEVIRRHPRLAVLF